MNLIFDFDGTLTPFSAPQYPIIKELGIDINEFHKKVLAKKDIYKGFVESFLNILDKNNLDLKKYIDYKADETNFNVGVLEFFEYFKDSSIFIVTCGFKDFVEKTKVTKYIKEVVGTTIDSDGKIDNLMNDTKKIEGIKYLIDKYKLKSFNIIYFGDGLTDMEVFKYIKEVGGVAVFLTDDLKNGKELLEHKQVDKVFLKDFSKSGEIFKFCKDFFER